MYKNHLQRAEVFQTDIHSICYWNSKNITSNQIIFSIKSTTEKYLDHIKSLE